MKRKIFTLQDHIKESLKNPEFKKAWEASEAEYQLSRALIRARINQKISQRELADKTKTTQAIISRIESMDYNPSVALLKRLAEAMGTKLKIGFE